MKDKDKWIKVPEVAKMFEVSNVTVYSWIKQGKIPKAIDLGETRWERKSLMSWIREHYQGVISE
jgi:excisionase family DNA binding protein|tara:strand:- start:206 stop:397 length:192 start_codon:yes stop_codon:yes gene_type:complete